MNAYLLIPLTACVTCAMLTAAILARDPQHRANRIAALIAAGGIWWSFLEVMWNSTWDAETALALVRLSSLGWFACGPLLLHFSLELTGRTSGRLRRALPALYGAAALFLVIDLATPWFHTGVVRTPWGWGYEFGVAYPPFFALTIGCATIALALAARNFRVSLTQAERRHAALVVAGVACPLTVSSVTDGLLPLLGHQVPHYGTASFTLLAASIAWGFHRYGYSLLLPVAFAPQILAALPDGVALLRLDGVVRSINAGLSRITGFSESELLGRDIAPLLPSLPLDAGHEVREFECSLSARGETISVAISTSWLRDKQREPIGIILLVRDLREVTTLRSHLVTSGRLAAVGQLAAGIAHEINNPIAFVQANLSALRSLPDSLSAKLAREDSLELAEILDEVTAMIDESLEGVDRVATIVRDVKSFAHAGGGREEVDVNALLDGVLRMVAPHLQSGAQIECCYGVVPPVRGAPQELKQLFLNLLINASHAVTHDQPIRLATSTRGARVLVRIEDEGCGIAPEVLARIFDPFFTTKPVGEGTGLGLAISHQIVRSHGGAMTVESEPGRGTSFCVELPASGR